MNRSRGQPAQGRFLLSFCATRAFTTFLISAVGSGLSVGKWMVPLDVEKPLSSFLNASIDRKSTRLNSSHGYISYAVFCLKKKKKNIFKYLMSMRYIMDN